MYPGDQHDPTRRMPEHPDSRAYSQAEWHDPRYQQDDSRDRRAPRPRGSGPGVDVGKFAGSVVAMALVAGLAGWLAAWVIAALFEKFGHTWSTGGNTPTMFAIYGAAAALLAGALWFLLLVGTPAPGRFFRWITGLLIAAAVVLPLLLVSPFLDALAAALVHLAIGLPILGLTGAFGNTFRR